MYKHTGVSIMSAQNFDDTFSAVFKEALKKMQETVKTSVSSSYEVHRSSGEVTVQRSDNKNWEAELPPKKTGTHG
jgi:hypothetical protein